jgi:hypothetical protein
MPVNIANTSDQDYDFACLTRRFRGAAGLRRWRVYLPVATSDIDSLTENEQDLRDLREALASSTNTISYEQFRHELGLD